MSEIVSNQARRADSPGVLIPPPLYYVVALLAGALLQWWAPLPYLPRPYDLALGGIALVAGVALAAASVATMLRGKGTLSTNAPSRALVTTGVFRFSRNPMYVSNALIYAGVASLFAMTWAFIFLPFLILLTDIAVIRREERFLLRHFGDDYRAYMARARRWL